ncbi:putative metal ion transporter YfjQ [Lysinibacillus alkalisoli]|uniref:Magnesium transport protein CorA n=1 Tax=Lysinibacillus alkalisoli TaxID=1911548 RepID=A0A917G8N9_9BACI|nr:magnesium/cobalt transporter CorA [Lysinibacillus alkalisoli]GGG28905.1 putative metal ion transporter YfjQ [Lysinibacillus alkalisoli]
MLHIVGYTKEDTFLKKLTIDELQQEQMAWFWVDFDQPTPEEEKLLEQYFHFHPLAIEDCLMRLQRPKMDSYDDYYFFVTHRINKETLEPEEVNIFVSEQFVVTFHKQHVPEIEIVRHRLNHIPKKWDNTPYYITYQTIDKMVDSYFPLVYQIEDQLNHLEDEMTYHNSVKTMQYVFDFRSDLLHLRRIVLPMRDLLYRVLSSYRLPLKKSERAYFADIHDHLVKLTEMVESNRELTADMRDSYMAMNSNRMNGIMMILTIVSTIFIPLTFIAGIYGMNFVNMPELSGKYSYFVVLGVMIFIAVAMLGIFKLKGWFTLFKS